MEVTSVVTKGITTSSGDTTVVQKISQLPRFFVHFRRAESVALSDSSLIEYKGEFGFDWLRDEYIYDVNMVHVLKNKQLYFKEKQPQNLLSSTPILMENP